MYNKARKQQQQLYWGLLSQPLPFWCPKLQDIVWPERNTLRKEAFWNKDTLELTDPELVNYTVQGLCMLEFVNDVLICYLIGSQLLNQMEGAGPPPADADKIEALPKVKISQELVGKITVIVFCKTVPKNNVACKLVQLSHAVRHLCIWILSVSRHFVMVSATYTYRQLVNTLLNWHFFSKLATLKVYWQVSHHTKIWF